MENQRAHHETKESACMSVWHSVHSNLLDIPDTKPSLFQAAVYGMSCSAFSWGTHFKGEVTNAEVLKSSICSEMTNTGLIAALVLTIAVSPLFNDAPSAMNKDEGDLYFFLWSVASYLLAFSTLVAVVALVHLEVFKEAKEINFLRLNMGVLVHVPLYFLLAGGGCAVGAFSYQLYFKVSFPIFLAMCGVCGGIFAFTAVIFTSYVRVAWDTFHPRGKMQSGEASKAF